MNVTTTSGLQNAWRQAGNYAAAITRDSTANTGNDLAGDVVGLIQAGSDFRANLAVPKVGERMDKQLLDILA